MATPAVQPSLSRARCPPQEGSGDPCFSHTKHFLEGNHGRGFFPRLLTRSPRLPLLSSLAPRSSWFNWFERCLPQDSGHAHTEGELVSWSRWGLSCCLVPLVSQINVVVKVKPWPPANAFLVCIFGRESDLEGKGCWKVCRPFFFFFGWDFVLDFQIKQMCSGVRRHLIRAGSANAHFPTVPVPCLPAPVATDRRSNSNPVTLCRSSLASLEGPRLQRKAGELRWRAASRASPPSSHLRTSVKS